MEASVAVWLNPDIPDESFESSRRGVGDLRMNSNDDDGDGIPIDSPDDAGSVY